MATQKASMPFAVDDIVIVVAAAVDAAAVVVVVVAVVLLSATELLASLMSETVPGYLST